MIHVIQRTNKVGLETLFVLVVFSQVAGHVMEEQTNEDEFSQLEQLHFNAAQHTLREGVHLKPVQHRLRQEEQYRY